MSSLIFVDCDSLIDCSNGFVLSAELQIGVSFFEVGISAVTDTGTVGFGVGKVNFVSSKGGVIPIALSYKK